MFHHYWIKKMRLKIIYQVLKLTAVSALLALLSEAAQAEPFSSNIILHSYEFFKDSIYGSHETLYYHTKLAFFCLMVISVVYQAASYMFRSSFSLQSMCGGIIAIIVSTASINYILESYPEFAKVIINAVPGIVGVGSDGAAEFLDEGFNFAAQIMSENLIFNISPMISIINCCAAALLYICCALASIRFILAKLSAFILATIGIVCLAFFPFVSLRGIAISYLRSLFASSLELGTIALIFKGCFISLHRYHQELEDSGFNMSLDSAMFLIFQALLLVILTWIIPGRVASLAYGDYTPSHRHGVSVTRVVRTVKSAAS